MSDPTSHERLLRASHLFSAVPADVRERCAATATKRAYEHGEHLWVAGDPAETFTVILSGLVKIARRTPEGGTTIVALFGPHESVGESAVLSRAPYPADAIAASATAQVLRVDAAPVLEAMQHDAAVARAMNEALLEHTTALQDKIRILSAGPVKRRLATLLLLLADRFGDEDERGVLRVPLPLSRGDLAELIGARVETTIRLLSRWRKAGLIETDSTGFSVLARDVLVEILEAPTQTS
jgi:CRP-like cAMP-binding protein